jgi:Cohesin domain
MKTVNAVLVGMALGALGTPSAWADPIPVVSITPDTKMVGLGGAFALEIGITNVSDLFAFQFDLGFGPGILSAQRISEGLFLPGGGTTVFILGTIDNAAGTITATADSLIGAISGVNGSGVLADVQFTALAPGTSTITLSNVLLLNSTLSPIDFSIGNGSVTVTSVPEPAALPLFGSALLCLGVAARRCSRRLA